MAKMRKRVFSMLLAILMIASLIPSVAFADEVSSTTEAIPGGTNTITVTVSSSGNVETTTTTQNWESTGTPAVEPSTEADGSVTTGTATSETTGTSTETFTVTDGEGATREDTEITGSESTTTVTDLTNTKVDENVVVDETPETTTDAVFVPDEGAKPTDTNNNDGSWIEGETEEGSFKPTTDPLPDPVESGTVPGVLEGNFLDGDNKNVDIWMKYEGSTTVETTVKHELDLNAKEYTVDILPEEIASQIKGKDADLDAGKTVTLADGREVTKTVLDNKVTYIVKTTSETTKESITEEQKQAELDKNKGEGEVTYVGETYYEYSDTSVEETYKTVPVPEGAETSTVTDEDGNVTYIETVKDAEGNVVKEIKRVPTTVNGKPAYDVIETTYTPYTPENGVVDENETPVSGYTELPKTLPAPDAVTKNGQTTSVSFESVLDESGKHMGYKAITTVTDKDGNTLSSSENVVNEDSYSYVADQSNDTTTTVTVSKLTDANGNHIGYTTSTVVTDKDGNTVSSKSNSVEQAIFSDGSSVETKYGQTIVSTQKTQIVSAQEKQDLKIENESYLEQSYFQDITKEVYQLVETKKGLYLVYNGQLLEVKGTAIKGQTEFVATGGEDGSVDVDAYLNSTENDDLFKDSNVFNSTGTVFEDYGNTTPGDWHLSGFGLVSQYAPANSDNDYHNIHHFELEDGSGNIIYAYCVEMDADIVQGENYNQSVFGKDDGNDSTTVDGGGSIAQLRSIATNGYWGTESGIGSLQAVKDLMKRNSVDDKYINMMTEGMAMVATQVAIWEYGIDTDEDGEDRTSKDVYFGTLLNAETGERNPFPIKDRYLGTSISSDEIEAINALRNLLISLSKNSEQGQAEIIDASDVKGAGVVLKDFVGQTENGDHIYNTDVQFGLDVSTSSLNGDLIVKILVNNNVVGKARLAGDNNNTMFSNLVDSALKTIHPNAQGIYTIEGIQLTEGIPFTINLDGIQHLDDGVYIIKDKGSFSSDWQDFISLTKQDVDVDISMDLVFTVADDPNFIKATQNWTEEKVDKINYSREDTGVRALKGTEESAANSAKVIGYTTTITTQSKTVKESSEWSSSATQGFIDPPLMPTGDGEIIEEELVPLAKAPGTGSNAWILVVAFVFSGCGLLTLNLAKRKED